MVSASVTVALHRELGTVLAESFLLAGIALDVSIKKDDLYEYPR